MSQQPLFPHEAPEKDITELDQWFTDPRTVARMLNWTWRWGGMHVLEPSAGEGAIALPILQELSHTHPKDGPCSLTAIELRAETFSVLRDRLSVVHLPSHVTLQLVHGDFEEWARASLDAVSIGPGTKVFDLAVMNPPYSKDRDVTHVELASRLARTVDAVVRLNFVSGVDRWERLWRWCQLRRQAICVRRPFKGAEHDFTALRLERQRTGGERPVGGSDEVRVEWWP